MLQFRYCLNSDYSGNKKNVFNQSYSKHVYKRVATPFGKSGKRSYQQAIFLIFKNLKKIKWLFSTYFYVFYKCLIPNRLQRLRFSQKKTCLDISKKIINFAKPTDKKTLSVLI